MSLSLLSSGLNWFVGFEDAEELVLVAPASFDRPVERMDMRRRCAHQLADVVLGESASCSGRRGVATRRRARSRCRRRSPSFAARARAGPAESRGPG
jgi:hypothetical protein